MSLNQLWQHDLTLVVYQADTSRNDTWQLSMSSGIRSWEADVPFESMGCSCWGLLKLNLFINQKQVESWRLKHTHVLQWVQSFRPAMYSHTSANAGNAFVSPNKFALLGREWKWLNYSFAWKDLLPAIWHMFNAFPPLLTAASWQLRLSWRPVASPFPW